MGINCSTGGSTLCQLTPCLSFAFSTGSVNVSNISFCRSQSANNHSTSISPYSHLCSASSQHPLVCQQWSSGKFLFGGPPHFPFFSFPFLFLSFPSFQLLPFPIPILLYYPRFLPLPGKRGGGRHGTGSHFVTQRPSDPGIQLPGDPVDPVTLFYNELQMSSILSSTGVLDKVSK